MRGVVDQHFVGYLSRRSDSTMSNNTHVITLTNLYTTQLMSVILFKLM